MGNVILLSVAAIICSAGLIRRVSVFDAFLAGAMEGLKTAVSILPALIALVTCVSMLRESGALSALASLLSVPASAVGIPREVIPLALVRPVSGSGALAAVEDIMRTCGVDSLAGRTAAVMMGSTETTFYTIAVYCGGSGIRKTGITLLAALLADLTGVIVSSLTTLLLMR